MKGIWIPLDFSWNRDQKKKWFGCMTSIARPSEVALDRGREGAAFGISAEVREMAGEGLIPLAENVSYAFHMRGKRRGRGLFSEGRPERKSCCLSWSQTESKGGRGNQSDSVYTAVSARDMSEGGIGGPYKLQAWWQRKPSGLHALYGGREEEKRDFAFNDKLLD